MGFGGRRDAAGEKLSPYAGSTAGTFPPDEARGVTRTSGGRPENAHLASGEVALGAVAALGAAVRR